MNKIIVSIVFALILILGINKISDVVFYVEKPEQSAYQVDSVTTASSMTASETDSESSGSENIMALFASVSSEDGKKVFTKCAACHSISKGGANKIGPALWGVIGRKAGAVSDYKYSKALLAYAGEAGNWNEENLDAWLKKPKDLVRKTKMKFPGLKKEADRADLIAYLKENGNN